jgi:hypothetical protein
VILPARLAPSAGTATEVVTTAAAATTATTVESAATSTARPAASADRLGLRFVDDNGSPVHLVLMELLNRFLRRLVRRHLDESESARPSGGHIAHDPGAGDIANRAEERGQLFIRGLVGKITDVEPTTHG